MIDKTHQDRHRHRTRFLLAVTAPAASMMIIALTAACSGGDSPPVTVSSSPPLRVPSGGAPTGSPRDQVIAVYTAYSQAAPPASMPEAQVRHLFLQTAVPGLAEFRLRGIRQMRAKNQEPWGQVVVHVTSVDITGSTARLSDCQDASGAGWADSRTRRLIPGTSGGTKPYNIAATLERGSNGRWLVTKVRPVEAPCTPRLTPGS